MSPLIVIEIYVQFLNIIITRYDIQAQDTGTETETGTGWSVNCLKQSQWERWDQQSTLAQLLVNINPVRARPDI